MTEEQQKRVSDILEKHDIQITVGGCGCCGSPWFKMTYKGQEIIDEDSVQLDMHEEEN